MQCITQHINVNINKHVNVNNNITQHSTLTWFSKVNKSQLSKWLSPHHWVSASEALIMTECDTYLWSWALQWGFCLTLRHASNNIFLLHCYVLRAAWGQNAKWAWQNFLHTKSCSLKNKFCDEQLHAWGIETHDQRVYRKDSISSKAFLILFIIERLWAQFTGFQLEFIRATAVKCL